jgi:hypothetical protein
MADRLEKPDNTLPGAERPGHPDQGLPKPPVARPKVQPLQPGPDAKSAAPVEGGDTVETSMGTLDRDTVMSNRVGGTGVVHVHSEPGPEVPPVASGQAGTWAGGSAERESGRTERK